MLCVYLNLCGQLIPEMAMNRPRLRVQAQTLVPHERRCIIAYFAYEEIGCTVSRFLSYRPEWTTKKKLARGLSPAISPNKEWVLPQTRGVVTTSSSSKRISRCGLQFLHCAWVTFIPSTKTHFWFCPHYYAPSKIYRGNTVRLYGGWSGPSLDIKNDVKRFYVRAVEQCMGELLC